VDASRPCAGRYQLDVVHLPSLAGLSAAAAIMGKWACVRSSTLLVSSSLHFTVANDHRMLQSEDEK
jgi:hypothetical protein